MYKIEDLVGIPFENKGRSLNGCDCMGLAVMTHESMGQTIPDFQIESDSSGDINSQFLEELHGKKWKKLTFPEAPCIVVFGFEPSMPDMVTHVGTYIGSGKILHTVTGKTSSVIKMDHPFFKNKILGFYKHE